MLDFINRTTNLGTTGKLARRERKYHGQTITDMRQDLIERAALTIGALEAYQRGPLSTPMARTIRNGICVKIGYGKRNVGFFEGPKDARTPTIPERNFDRKLAAIDYLQQAIAAVKAGEFDQMLQNKLNEMTSKFPGRSTTNNVRSFPKAQSQNEA